ncbi:unnamed protein product, partial [Rotaria sordida]
ENVYRWILKKYLISDSILLEQALEKRHADPYLRSTSSIETKNDLTNSVTNEMRTVNSLLPVDPSPPPLSPSPLLSSLSNVKSPSRRITVDDFRQSSFQSLTKTNVEYRLQYSSNNQNLNNSTIIKLIQNCRESDFDVTNKEQQQTELRIKISTTRVIPVIDLKTIFNDSNDYANHIEPDVQGGSTIVENILYLGDHHRFDENICST